MTAVQESLPIKIAVYDNGKLGFIDIEQKSLGLIPVYTDLKNPNFGEVAKAMGIWGHQVSHAGDLEEVRADLACATGTWGARCEGEADATGDAPFALRFAGSRGPSTPPRRCCTAKDTTSGKWWSRTSRDRMKSSLSLRAGALIVRDAARTGSRLNPFPRNWGQRISKQWNNNMPTSTAPAPLAPASLQSSSTRATATSTSWRARTPSHERVRHLARLGLRASDVDAATADRAQGAKAYFTAQRSSRLIPELSRPAETPPRSIAPPRRTLTQITSSGHDMEFRTPSR